MNKFIIIYICSLVLATGSFAQTPTVSPIASTPAATATISATSTPASKIEQWIRKKHKKHFGFTINDHDTDLDRLDHGKSPDDLPTMVIPIVAIVFLTIFGAPVLIVGADPVFQFLPTARSPRDGADDGRKRAARARGAAESATGPAAAFRSAPRRRPDNDWRRCDGVSRCGKRVGGRSMDSGADSASNWS